MNVEQAVSAILHCLIIRVTSQDDANYEAIIDAGEFINDDGTFNKDECAYVLGEHVKEGHTLQVDGMSDWPDYSADLSDQCPF
jgi:hypothetical protein